MPEVCVNCETPLPQDSRFCSKCGTPVPGHDNPTLTPQGREIYDRLVQATQGYYEIVKELGRGGMAVVFLGYQKSLDREVAIKVLLPLLGYDPDLVQRFMREARTQGKLEHPHIISVYEVYNQGGLTFFSMPYVPGENLRTHLHRQSKPPVATVRRFLRQAAEALGYAHGRGVIHRDVKPDNILVSEERNSVILTDFGIAKAMSAQTTLTTPGDLLGTPLYMSPEQGEGRKDIDGRADQYSLGLIGYEMLAGEPAFKAENLAELMYKHRFEDPESIHNLRPDVPKSLRMAICRAISKVPEERFPDMNEFATALETEPVRVVEEATENEADSATVGIEEPTLRIVTPDSLKSVPPPKSRAGRPAPVHSAPTARVVTPDSSETIGLGSLVPRRRGMPAIVKLGGAGAVLAAAGLAYWFVLGPGAGIVGDADSVALQAGVDGQPAAVQPGETEADRVDSDAGTDPSSGGGVPAAGGDDQPGDAGGEATAGGETTPGAVETEAGQDAADASAGGEPVRAVDSNELPALRAQERAAQVRNSALGSGADQLLGDELAALDARFAAAESDMNAGRFSEALAAYSGLIQDYGSLSGRVATISRQRDEAANARRATDSSREAAVAAGALTDGADRLARIDRDRGAAEELFNRRDYEAAIPGFQRTEAAYEQLAADLVAAAQRRAEVETPPTDDAGAADAGPPPPPVATPEQQVTALLERFRQTFEQEDLVAMGSEVYRSGVPNNDQRILKYVFDSADELQVVLRMDREIQFDQETARAEITLDLAFRQSRTGDRGTRDLKLRLDFASDAAGWRLASLRQR